MKYLMITDIIKLIESVPFKDEKNYILSLEKTICDRFISKLTDEYTMIILNEGVFYNKGADNWLFNEISFLYFINDKSLPFQAITAKYPKLVIIAGTILWDCKGKDTFFNTTVVFQAGAPLFLWDKQGVAQVDLPKSKNEIIQNYMRVRNNYWGISKPNPTSGDFYPCFRKPFLNPYEPKVLRPLFTFNSRKYEIIICKDIFTYYQYYDLKDTTIIYIAHEGLIHLETVSLYPESKIIYCDNNATSSITYKGIKPIKIDDRLDPKIRKMFVSDTYTLLENVRCYED